MIQILVMQNKEKKGNKAAKDNGKDREKCTNHARMNEETRKAIIIEDAEFMILSFWFSL